MDQASEGKIYIGNGKKIEGRFGTFRKVSLCLTKIPQEHIYEYEGKTYISVIVNDKQQKDQYGNDVSMTIDTWKPEPREGQPQERKEIKATELNEYNQDNPDQSGGEGVDIDSIPF
jgi:hypothetical protein